jgi:hypothetical protein
MQTSLELYDLPMISKEEEEEDKDLMSSYNYKFKWIFKRLCY